MSRPGVTAVAWVRTLRRRLLALLVLLAVLALINSAGAVWRSTQPAVGAPTAACPPADGGRKHFLPPRTEPPLPPGSDIPVEQAPPTWIGFTKPLAFDFTRALLRGSEEQAREFVAPDVDFQQAAWRQRLGVTCPPDIFTVKRTLARADQVVIEPTVYYVDHTVTFRLIFRPYPDRWRIVAAEPADDPPSATPTRAGR